MAGSVLDRQGCVRSMRVVGAPRWWRVILSGRSVAIVHAGEHY